MSLADPVGPRVSLRRVVLLFVFGASACMALTPPGQWVASRLLPCHRPGAWAPLYLESARHSERLAEDLDRAFADMREDEDHPVGTLPVPTDAGLAERLAGLEGWTTCVVFELGSTPAQIEAAGIADREQCVAIANAGARLYLSPGRLEAMNQLHFRSWSVLLLDAQGRRMANASICALRPGFELVDPLQRIYAEVPGALGDGPLPAVRVFHLTEAGVVVAG
jgi:hypothetical protein